MDAYLAHYGVPGMRWGIRRFQNEDGSYTNKGMQRLQEYQQSMANRFSNAKIRITAIRKSSNKTQALAQRTSPKQIDQSKKERAKKIMIAAGAVTLATVAAVVVHKRNKVNQNLMQLAKNKMHENYKDAIKSSKGEALAKLQSERTKDMLKIDSRREARKVLGLRSRRSTKAFIKDNKISKMKTADIIERRLDGPLVEGYQRNAHGKFVKIGGRRLEKARKRVARSFYV